MSAPGTLVRYSPDYVERAASDLIAAKDFVPSSYLDEHDNVKEVDVRLACSYLAAIDADPRTFFRGSYVIGARVELMAEPQRVLLARHGYDLDFLEETDERCTARIRRIGGRWKRPVTITIQEARTKGWAAKNAVNYDKQPDAMLRARATTRLVSLYAPEVKYLLADVDRRFGFEPGAVEEEAEEEAAGALARSADALGGEYHTVRRDERAVPPERLEALERKIGALEPGRRDDVRAWWKGHDGPNLRGPEFTIRDALLLERVVDEYARPRAGEAAGEDKPSPSAGAGETSHSAEPAPAAAEDPTRPFE